MTPKIGSLKQEPLSFAHDFMNHKLGKGVASRHCGLSFISLAALLYGVWLPPSHHHPTQTSQEDKGLLQGIFLPSLKSITSLLPNCIGQSCHKPAQN